MQKIRQSKPQPATLITTGGALALALFLAWPSPAAANYPPRTQKLITLGELQVLDSDDRRIERAIDHLQASLAPELWEDDEHLVKDHGKRVFDEEQQAVRELDKVLADGGPEATAAGDAILELLTADDLLARTALDEAIAAAAVAGCEPGDEDGDSDSGSGCDCGKALREIAKAEEELAKAVAAQLAGEFEKAVSHYRKAWDRACKASQAVAECPSAFDCPCEAFPLWASVVNLTADVANCQLFTDSPDVIIVVNLGTPAGAFVDASSLGGTEGSCSENPGSFVPLDADTGAVCAQQLSDAMAALQISCGPLP